MIYFVRVCVCIHHDRAGYCFVNLRSAIEFILVVDATMLTVEPAYFEQYALKLYWRLDDIL
jgi:hypothetical protein